MSDPLLRDYELKRCRAMHHFNVLRESIEGFANIDHEPILGEFDPDTSKYVFEVPLERLGGEWSLRLGDFLYDTRASLDYLITALIRSAGNEEHDGSQFPIYDGSLVGWQDVAKRWETDGRVTRQLDGTPSSTRATLKQLQPFDGVPTLDPRRHPLFVLRELNNRDKHRRLNLLTPSASVQFVDASGEPIYEGPDTHTRIAQSDERDAYTATLAVDRKLDVDVYLLATYNVSLHEPPNIFGNLLETLTSINKYIDARVLPTVRTLL
jgi:hypothetical protein